MVEIITVRYSTDRRLGEFVAHDLRVRVGDRCIVTTARGVELGRALNGRPTDNLPRTKFNKILRKATERDLYLYARKTGREERAFRLCQKRIKVRELPMKLSRVEYIFDGSRVVFYFTAEHRVDFRALVRDLARQLRTRIEMRQIGARDEARLVGGLGFCGRGENCSKLFLNDLRSVSVRTAKEQGLGMNMNRLSGMCGRLKCCLNYESNDENGGGCGGGQCGAGDCGCQN